MEEERGHGLSVISGDPGSEDKTEPHGLQYPVHPVHADPIRGMEEVQAEQETRKLSTGLYSTMQHRSSIRDIVVHLVNLWCCISERGSVGWLRVNYWDAEHGVLALTSSGLVGAGVADMVLTKSLDCFYLLLLVASYISVKKPCTIYQWQLAHNSMEGFSRHSCLALQSTLYRLF